LDKLFEEQKGPGSRRIVTENTTDDNSQIKNEAPMEWTEELENSLILAVEKHRKYGSNTTFDIIRKDISYKDFFGDRYVSALSKKFTELVHKERIRALVPDNTVVDELFAARVGGEQNQPLGILVEFTINDVSIFLLVMREELNKNKN
jgi:hypothetical protein